jgi:hypothetical protein
MTDIDIINEMIRSTAKIPLEENYGRSFVKLVEPQTSDSSVTISGIPSNAVVIKADAFRSPDTIFTGLRGECKRADYIIISDTGQKKRLLYIEMKRTNPTKTGIIAQLTGAECFIRYCRAVAELFWKQPTFLSAFQPRFVFIGDTGSIRKQRTREVRKFPINDKPEKMLAIHWPSHLEYNRLVGA